MLKSRLFALAATPVLAAGLMASAATASHADDVNYTASFAQTQSAEQAMTNYVMTVEGMNKADAQEFIAEKGAKASSLRKLESKGFETDGAYYKGTKLVVVVDSDADAKKAKNAGLTPSRGLGQSDLDAKADKVLKATNNLGDAVISVGSDLPTGTIDVKTTADGYFKVRNALKHHSGVKISIGKELETQADVVPGQIMDLQPGTNCSLGFPGRLRDGRQVVMTAGHCVEGYPDIYDRYGNYLGKSIATRFATNRYSVDMGLMDIASGNRGVPFVDSRGHSGYYQVRGMSKNPVGSELCKAGNTTGWTCGRIQSYNQTVNYSGTQVSGLARATVCTEGGDSGGAYIGEGNLAQGVTSGGPVGVNCGWNQDYRAGSYSFYQPVVDIANYYGVTITTANNW